MNQPTISQKLQHYLARRRKEVRKSTYRAVRRLSNQFGFDLLKTHVKISPREDRDFPQISPRTKNYLPRKDAHQRRNADDQRSIALALLVTGEGSLAFAQNCLLSLERSGNKIPAHVFMDSDMGSNSFFQSLNFEIVVHNLEAGYSGKHGYLTLGEAQFNRLTQLKWQLVGKLLQDGYDIVVFSDIDIIYFRDFEGYIRDISQIHAMGFQSEATGVFPPTLCTGFMFFTREAGPAIHQLIEFSQATPEGFDDQQLLNHSLRRNINSYQHVAVLPEAHFPNGLLFPQLCGMPHKAAVHALTPFLFHANWMSSQAAKKDLFASIGEWRVEVKN